MIQITITERKNYIKLTNDETYKTISLDMSTGEFTDEFIIKLAQKLLKGDEN